MSRDEKENGGPCNPAPKPRLTEEEFLSLVRRISAGGADGKAAEDELWAAFRLLAIFIAREELKKAHLPLPTWKREGDLSPEDLARIGFEKSLKALEKYDPLKGKHATYFGTCIRNAIRDKIKEYKRHLWVTPADRRVERGPSGPIANSQYEIDNPDDPHGAGTPIPEEKALRQMRSVERAARKRDAKDAALRAGVRASASPDGTVQVTKSGSTTPIFLRDDDESQPKVTPLLSAEPDDLDELDRTQLSVKAADLGMAVDRLSGAEQLRQKIRSHLGGSDTANKPAEPPKTRVYDGWSEYDLLKECEARGITWVNNRSNEWDLRKALEDFDRMSVDKLAVSLASVAAARQSAEAERSAKAEQGAEAKPSIPSALKAFMRYDELLREAYKRLGLVGGRYDEIDNHEWWLKENKNKRFWYRKAREGERPDTRPERMVLGTFSARGRFVCANPIVAGLLDKRSRVIQSIRAAYAMLRPHEIGLVSAGRGGVQRIRRPERVPRKRWLTVWLHRRRHCHIYSPQKIKGAGDRLVFPRKRVERFLETLGPVV